MRRTALALIALALTLTPTVDAARRAVSPPPTVTATSFVFSGRGWGHGVGMSQYGALGYAEEGLTYDAILAHYYPGTALGPAAISKLRVLLAEARGSVTVASEAPFRVRDVFGKTYPLPAGKQTLGPRLEVVGTGPPLDLTGPLTFLPGTAPLSVDGVAYRGQIEVAVVAKKLNAVDVVGLEDYLAGVVPREMPAAWAAEALKAQAVAARSYALAHRAVGKSFDLYADVRSQVYGGIGAEDPRATAAVTATAGQVLLYEGKIVNALFHSTSGGRTVSAREAFGTDVPYLVPVDDPHSSLSPVDRWATAVGDATVRKGLSLATPVLGLKLTKGQSGRVASATVTTTTGIKTVTGSELRFALGLRSTWVTALGTLALTRPGGSAVVGRPTTIRAAVKGLKNIRLERRTPAGWEVVAERPAPGELAYTAKLDATTSFRLSAGRTPGPLVKVPVGPLVKAAPSAAGIAGTVAPFTAGIAVQVQRLEGTLWLPAGAGVVDEAGAYRVELDTGPGTYRVRVPPAGGLAQALSAVVKIP